MPQTATTDDVKNFLTPNYVDLASLPPPKIVEELDFEKIFQELLADFKSRRPEYDALLESDPAIAALQCAAYREVLLRQKINEAAKANMLAYAADADLDNLAAFYGIERQENEQDERLRYRTQLALEGLTTAGSEKAYLFHALTADQRVKSASVQSPAEGKVLISILSNQGDGAADTELIKAVADYVGKEDKRPLTDNVIVRSAQIVPFAIHAKIYVFPGPSVSITTEQYTANLRRYVDRQHNIGAMVALSGIFDALHAEGVQKVQLIKPDADIAATKSQAAFCTDINLEVVVVNDTN